MRLIKKTAGLRPLVSFFSLVFVAAGWILALSHEASAQNLRLVWSDDFKKPGPLDPTKWEFELGNRNGWGNRELEYYTDRPENISIDGSGAEVVARKEEYQGFHYTSAKFHSLASWQYGVVEVKAKLPDGRGMWPAIWLMPQYSLDGGWPNSGEIDMMEEVAFDPNVAHFTLHQSSGGPSNTIKIPTLTSQYHTYRLEWTPDHIAGYVDDHPYYRYDRGTQDWHGWPYDQPFYLIINDAVGGNWGGTDGVDDSAFPQTLSIASVHVYKRISHPHGGKARSLPGTVEAADYDDGGEGYAYHSDFTNNSLGKYRNDGISIGATGDPKHPYYVGGIRPDQWMNYTVHVDTAGAYDMTFYTASPYRDAKFRIEVDDTPITNFRAPYTGSWSTWKGSTAPNVKLSAGDHVVRFISDWTDLSFSYFEATPASAPAVQ